MSVHPSDGEQQAIEHIVEHNLPKPKDNSEFIVFTDASVSEGWTHIGVGWVICRTDGSIVCKGSQTIGKGGTPQEAESIAVDKAINQMKSMDWFDAGVTVYLDNQSIVESFDRWTKNHKYDVFKRVYSELDYEEVKWIRRDYNELADKLSVEARKRKE